MITQKEITRILTKEQKWYWDIYSEKLTPVIKENEMLWPKSTFIEFLNKNGRTNR